ncbi:galactose mutarotase [Bacillus sp. CH30_1T]|uniref:aldose epimerase family protein n=1 Tax=Bacillus sp. CH30_1T TaxID=2604836 RepID=UPI0011ECEB9A|nr:aldose epimerase family protein [Bacillus sp. CH30_1T]KAA0566672.1 galactose mutarotase [Bacillus sp. CH30_1T]
MKIDIKDLQRDWKEYTLRNDHGMAVSLLNYGGIITRVMVPDQDGTIENVIIGYKQVEDYETNPHFFGALIGPVAGRIQGAAFELDGNVYMLEANDGENHLHGGSNGFHQVLWDTEPFQDEDRVGVVLSYSRKDREGGYPGTIDVSVTYLLTNENELILEYEAVTDQPTPLTLTNHAYFNLSGNGKETIHHHHVTIDSHQFLELDEELIPTGTVVDAGDTPFDFRMGRRLSDGITARTEQNDIAGHGYDHYFLLDHSKSESVTVKEQTSGRVLTIETDQPGMVMYTTNNLQHGLELHEGTSRKHLGVCFETQYPTASLHHYGLPSVILLPNERYQQRTVFTFSTEN